MLSTFKGPSSPADFNTWYENLASWKETTLAEINFNGSIFEVPEILWTQTTFMQPQIHPYDQFFYNITTHSYTPDKFVNDLNDRYGGVDSMLVWPTYPNIGCDDRNQYDLILSMPGGLPGIKELINTFHNDYGIKILWPYNPWDQYTNYVGTSDDIAMAILQNETHGDGFNGDTMGYIPETFYTYSANVFNHPIALEAGLFFGILFCCFFVFCFV